MASAKDRAQEAEVSRALLECVRAYGTSWWRAWDALQWSPVGIFDGVPYRGGERLVLAVLSLARGYGDRRWASEEDLEAHGYQTRRNSRGALLTVGNGQGHSLVFNADCVVRARAKGVRHGAPVPDDRARRDSDERTITRLVSATVASGTWPVRQEQRASVTYSAESGEVIIPGRTDWGRTPANLRELLEALACASIHRHPCDPSSDDYGVASFVATLASVMALSDLGIAPSDACQDEGETGTHAAPEQLMRELTGGLSRLMECADRAEKAAAQLGEVLANLPKDLALDGDKEDDEPVGQKDERAKEETPIQAEVPHVRPPLRKTSIPAFGGYTLRDVVVESERACAALSRAPSARG